MEAPHISPGHLAGEELSLVRYELCRQITESSQMLAIKGIGLISVSEFLAEEGDIRRFDSPKQIQKLAGLSSRENSSGKPYAVN